MFTYSFVSLSDLAKKVKLVKPLLTDQEVFKYIVDVEYVLDEIEQFEL